MTDGFRDGAPITDDFVPRHLGHTQEDIASMLDVVGVDGLDTLVDQAVPSQIRFQRALELTGLDGRLGERALIDRLRQFAQQNQVYTSLIGMGYSDTVTPPVIQRNILENPGWYTQYTPYQAEIAQGLVATLEDHTQPGTQERAAAALWTMVKETPGNEPIIAKAGGFVTLQKPYLKFKSLGQECQAKVDGD